MNISDKMFSRIFTEMDKLSHDVENIALAIEEKTNPMDYVETVNQDKEFIAAVNKLEGAELIFNIINENI